MKLQLENFRSFQNTGSIPVKQVNLLVGENSSGKTSFMAATKFLFDVFSNGRLASFNSEPFYLGSFKDIAHVRGGRAGRAKEFILTTELDVKLSPKEKSRKEQYALTDLFLNFDDNPKLNNRLKLKLHFSEYKSQSNLNQIEIISPRSSLKMKFERSKLIFTDGSKSTVEIENPFAFRVSGSGLVDLNYLYFLLRDVKYITRNDDEDTNNYDENQMQIIDKIDAVGTLFRQVSRQLQLDTIATEPVRTEPQRVYQISDRESNKTANQAAFELAQISAFEVTEWKDTKNNLEKFGQNSGLFKEINIRHLSRNKDGPFQIELKIGKQPSNIIDVGYGVSQAIPLVFDLLRTSRASVFFIQQPEVHLHPKAQVELASMMLEIASKRKHILFVETHSDFIIDRIRSDVRDHDIYTSNDVGLLFFERGELESYIYPIDVSEKGELKNIPESYRKFFLDERRKSMGV